MSTQDTPLTDADSRQYPQPEYAQRIVFEGCEMVVICPDDYEALYEHARALERVANRLADALAKWQHVWKETECEQDDCANASERADAALRDFEELKK